ncbi:MAG: ABC transporter permease, partial [Clostridium saudiense]|nr:ABC transporter permease [Clostridium saudiense]
DWLSPIVKANPVTNILLMFRDVMLNGNFPNILGILIAFIETALALGVGLYVFYKNQDQFILNI